MTTQTLPYHTELTSTDKERLLQWHEQNLELSELWAIYGQAALGSAATGEPPEVPGRRSFNRLLPRFKTALCNDSRIQTFMDSDQASDVLALAMVFTARLASEQFQGIDVCAAGMLIARIGLRKLCASDYIE